LAGTAVGDSALEEVGVETARPPLLDTGESLEYSDEYVKTE
jgi:hypothetical protein